MRTQRGYLLIEAMISGVVLAVVLATCLSLVAGARAESSYAAKRQTAAALARAKLDELMSAPTVVASTTPLTVINAVKYPGLRMSTSITDVSSTYNTTSVLGIDGSLFEIVVTVEHPTISSPQTLSLRTLRRVR